MHLYSVVLSNGKKILFSCRVDIIIDEWVAIYLVSNTFTITMAVFDVGQSVVNSASGIINGETAIDVSSLSMQMQAAMATMEIGELVVLALETFLVSFCMKIMSVVITVIVYGRMIEIYLYTSLAPTSFLFKSGKEETLEGLYRFSKGRKKTREKSARAEKKVEVEKKSSRLKFSESEGGMAEEVAETSLKKKPHLPPPTAAGGEATKTVGSKFYQKKQYKDAYAAAKRGRKVGSTASKQTATAANTLAEKAKAAVQEIVVQSKTLWAGLGIAALMLMLIMGAFSSCSAAIQGTGSTFIGTTYPSKDADMKGAEEDYLELEKKLDEQIRQMESTHPGYDEYRYQLDEIGHDPYQLIRMPMCWWQRKRISSHPTERSSVPGLPRAIMMLSLSGIRSLSGFRFPRNGRNP